MQDTDDICMGSTTGVLSQILEGDGIEPVHKPAMSCAS